MGIVGKDSGSAVVPKDEKAAEQTKKERFEDLKERIGMYKPMWDKNGIIQFKNECIAILQRRLGAQVEFIIAFEDLTREGYRLMAIDESGGNSGAYFYFQKMEYVK